ncbi:hypothetical protein [Vulcanisaeta sp. JCM 16159]|nr:hypothetical protein [Vulcanisaeta sp. JCM 16159]
MVEVRGSGLIKIVYTGDTAPANSIIDIARGAQMLIHESTFSAVEDET